MRALTTAGAFSRESESGKSRSHLGRVEKLLRKLRLGGRFAERRRRAAALQNLAKQSGLALAPHGLGVRPRLFTALDQSFAREIRERDELSPVTVGMALTRIPASGWIAPWKLQDLAKSVVGISRP